MPTLKPWENQNQEPEAELWLTKWQPRTGNSLMSGKKACVILCQLSALVNDGSWWGMPHCETCYHHIWDFFHQFTESALNLCWFSLIQHYLSSSQFSQSHQFLLLSWWQVAVLHCSVDQSPNIYQVQFHFKTISAHPKQWIMVQLFAISRCAEGPTLVPLISSLKSYF